MSITITTLNNEAAAAKTFTKVAGDRNVTEYYNSTDATALFDTRLFLKQQIVGKQNGIPNRRWLAQCAMTMTDSITGVAEVLTVNVTMTGPTQLQNLSATNRKDALAFLRNLLTAAIEEQLSMGEL